MIISLLLEPFRNSSLDHVRFVCAIRTDMIVFLVVTAFHITIVTSRVRYVRFVFGRSLGPPSLYEPHVVKLKRASKSGGT